MQFFCNLIPLSVFIVLFAGSGLYLTSCGVDNAFYQVSPLVCMLGAFIAAWFLNKASVEDKINAILEGMRHKDIISMIIIFMLSGAFVLVTQSIGAVQATINAALFFLSPHFVLVGIFLCSAFIATAIGTSMGTIATIAPLAHALACRADFSSALAVATVVGGAMFGDNLSLVSDTTIAAVASQGADMKKKLIINAQIASVASALTMLLLFFSFSVISIPAAESFSPVLIIPYGFLFLHALSGAHVFIVLLAGIVIAGFIGLMYVPGYTMVTLSKSIHNGFMSMSEISLLSLCVGALSELSGRAGIDQVATRVTDWLDQKTEIARTRYSQLIIALLALVFDVLLANNTIAIIVSGPFAKKIAQKSTISAEHAAAWLDIFSCVGQGLIPYGAQILLASSIAQVSPLAVVGYVYYCYFLALSAILCICFSKPKKIPFH